MAKLFRREQHSLFGEILDWMLAPLLVLWPMSLGLTWVVAQSIANGPFDRSLADVATVRVGAVSGADEIYVSDLHGNRDFVSSSTIASGLRPRPRFSSASP